jgi:hypothetical protein
VGRCTAALGSRVQWTLSLLHPVLHVLLHVLRVPVAGHGMSAKHIAHACQLHLLVLH